MSSLIGRTLGQYEIVDRIGQGGMATVYLGRQQSIDRLVAIKVLPPHPALDDAFKERFQLEARTIGNLQNPNILPLYDYGTFEDVLYLVMAYAEGGTLADLVDSAPMDVREVERILRPIASGLDYAHSKGVIHRDIKPANILIQDGHPLLADFGMVKMVAEDSNLTGTAIVGTPSYMAPEQGQGLKVDHRIDVYALGAMVYEMLTGQQVYEGETPMQMILAHISSDIPDIRLLRPDLNADLAEIMRQSLAKKPDERYQSAGAFAEAFSGAIHKNEDTLADVQKAYPITANNQTNALDDSATVVLDQKDISAEIKRTASNVISPEQTPTQVIVRDSVNPLVLLGGFGLIAVAIVVIAVLLINNDAANDPAPTESPQVLVTEPPTISAPLIETFGLVRFNTENVFNDRVEIRLSGAIPLTGDQQYHAWLYNTETEDTLHIGRVVVDGFGEGTTTYTDDGGHMLAAMYNAVLISRQARDTDVPTGTIAYSASLPIAVSDALHEIFVSSEDGFDGVGSLLDGAKTEAESADLHAGLAARATNMGGVRTHAEHTINILTGETLDRDGSGDGQNPGRGVGVFFFLDAIDTILTDVTNRPEATIDLQTNADFMHVCAQNVRQWADEIIQLEFEMIAGENMDAIADQTVRATELSRQLQHGFDLNENGIIEPFEGECGLNQIPDFALQIAHMDIVEGDITNDEE